MYPSMFIEELAAQHRRDLEENARRWRLASRARHSRSDAQSRRAHVRFRRHTAVATAEHS